MKLKTSAGVIVATLVLSSIVWTIFYLYLPGPALSPAETLIVVGFCLGIVLLGCWVGSLLRRVWGRHAHQG
jgi:hypothetical protein